MKRIWHKKSIMKKRLRDSFSLWGGVLLFFFLVPAVSVSAGVPALFFSPDDSAVSTEPSPMVKAVRAALTGIKPFRVTFVQQVFSDREMDIEESGSILFEDDQHLKWIYRVPDYKVFLLVNEDYRFYDEENEQLTVGKVKRKSRQWIWQLLFSDDMGPYTRTESDGGVKKLYIKKEEGENALDVEIHLGDDFLPVRVIQVDPTTDVRMVFKFGPYEGNVRVPENAFELKVPTDVEIIREDR